MDNLTIPITTDLRIRVESAATAQGVSLDEFVRESLLLKLSQSDRARDPFFADIAVYEGDAPHDLSERHDDYLYGDSE